MAPLSYFRDHPRHGPHKYMTYEMGRQAENIEAEFLPNLDKLYMLRKMVQDLDAATPWGFRVQGFRF